MRIGFSIILNGLHHLKHNDYAEYLANNLDLWIIAEGACLNQGSTKWCKAMPERYHDVNGSSVDGTWSYIIQLSDYYHNVVIANENINSLKFKEETGTFWNSKDSQVNACIETLKHMNFNWKIDPIYLWQIDCDEQWDLNNMKKAEEKLLKSNCRVGMFHCNYWVGSNLQVKGEWGEGLKLPYRRLWLWEGEYFKTHEPPLLGDGFMSEVLLPQRFEHYAYYFEKDVRFKNDWYSGHEGILQRWKQLNNKAKLQSIGVIGNIDLLLYKDSYWGKTKTRIHKVKI